MIFRVNFLVSQTAKTLSGSYSLRERNKSDSRDYKIQFLCIPISIWQNVIINESSHEQQFLFLFSSSSSFFVDVFLMWNLNQRETGNYFRNKALDKTSNLLMIIAIATIKKLERFCARVFHVDFNYISWHDEYFVSPPLAWIHHHGMKQKTVKVVFFRWFVSAKPAKPQNFIMMWKRRPIWLTQKRYQLSSSLCFQSFFLPFTSASLISSSSKKKVPVRSIDDGFHKQTQID